MVVLILEYHSSLLVARPVKQSPVDVEQLRSLRGPTATSITVDLTYDEARLLHTVGGHEWHRSGECLKVLDSDVAKYSDVFESLYC